MTIHRCRRWFQLSLKSLFLLTLLVATFFAGYTAKRRPKQTTAAMQQGPLIDVKPDKDGTVEAVYHRFVVLKYKGTVLALHILPDPAHGHDGIDYRWYELTDGTDRFYRPSPNEADGKPNPAIKTGSGATHEGEQRYGEGDIKVGALTIPWSKGDHRSGWLYLLRQAKEIDVYPVQFERLEDCSGALDAKRWIKLGSSP